MAKWEYAPAPESTEIVDIKDTYGLYIGGQFVEPASGEYFKTINPATEEVLAAIPVADEEDIDRAVGAAGGAFKMWSALPGTQRAK
jgi:aldehyde dehydrogenase (NAD+)